ncbi:Ig-like domain-containing protein [Flavobacterium muglaense]|uniref:T9SS type B sorting domain-containing protein n=1 Tax=Flavobacterium muglaense TaxID=2764716 RepID=A0A923SEP2_9FLAO|nr:T9SS type B sorting domain-containing protein [Flavobacterium muglaense]MBC5837202.1 T9SS type B sorting domain-containing protein [Flavobacterium muglaense]MBC5843731.1 T9SS type B sorting domain-containing protein [Flavobacterium muglaense]
MGINNLFKIVLAFAFLSSNHNFANSSNPKTEKNKPLFANVAPIITATGNQVYCPQSSLKIVTTVSITDPDDTNTDAIYIQISNGYLNGQDQLTLSNPSLHATISASWNASEGKLKLSSPTPGTTIPYTDFIAAIKDVVFTNSSSSPSGIRDFSISIGQANYLPSNGHYYQFVSNLGIGWNNAKNAAAASNYYGLQGYLATITSADEAKISGEQAAGAGWIGGSDAATEGVWKWVTGPEGLANGGNGTIFWNGLANGSTPNYANWNTNEPNQSGDEDYAHITAPGVGITGAWNDLKETGDASGNYQPKGYIVEYGGMAGDPILQISTSTRITIPRIESTIAGSVCNSGNVSLQATASNGAVYWYDSTTAASPIFTGSSFTTPILNTTTTYYVDATNNNCPSTPRTAVVATVHTLPTITATSPGAICDSGTTTLGAVASAGSINWYDVPSGGTSLATGTSFTTPIISSTTTYFVDATANGCTTAARTAITATVNSAPTITATTPAARCDSGTVTLSAIASAGTINWYEDSTTGTTLFSGNTFTTPTINATTTYYAEAAVNNCSSARIAVTATTYPITTTTEEVVLCLGETIILDAGIANRTYLWAPGGETTQTITASTTGNYTVTIGAPAVASCDSKKEIKVIEHPKPIINNITVNENAITIALDNPQSYYEYSVNGIDFQSLNQFSYLPSGQYTAFVRENNGCNLIMQDFTIFSISKFFTPNNDGYNDFWKIPEMVNYPNSKAQVYDRYGKFIIELNTLNFSWDGKLNGKNLPSDDYWYRLKLEDSKPELKGHFSLKR